VKKKRRGKIRKLENNQQKGKKCKRQQKEKDQR